MSNKVLDAAEAKIESQLTPEVKNNYMKIVAAGMKVALNKGPDSILYSLKNSKDPINDCAIGAVSLTLMLRKQSRGTMPIKAMIPAAMTLMLKALNFADSSGLAKVGEAELVRATHIFTNLLFKAFHITPAMLHKAAANVHGITQDPQKMDRIHRAAGFKAGSLNDMSPTPIVSPGMLNRSQ